MLQRNDRLPEALRKARTKAGLSQEGLAEAIGVSGGAVCNWETGVNMPGQGKVDSLNTLLFGGTVAEQSPVEKKAATKTVTVKTSTKKGNSSLSSYDTENLTAELKRRGFKVTLTF